jgi:NarL family two-component system response regulator LiaR
MSEDSNLEATGLETLHPPLSPCRPKAADEEEGSIAVSNWPSRIQVLIVDDHAAVRRALATFLTAFKDLELVGEAGSGQEALQICERTLPDVILMDLVMPGMNGALATCAIRERWPGVQVIALTSFQEADLMHEAIQSGAVSCLLKNVSAEELAEAIRIAYKSRTESPRDPGRNGHSSNGNGSGGNSDPCRHMRALQDQDLRPREREVLGMLVKGFSYSEIAETLTVNSLTARFHVQNVLGKLGVTSRGEAVALALQKDLMH